MAQESMKGTLEAQGALRRAMREMDLGQTSVLRDLGGLFRKGEGQIFRTYGSIINRPWPPLADSTAKSRARMARKFGLSISPRAPRLVLFGDMKAALTEEGGPHHVRIEGNRIEIEVDQKSINRHNRATGQNTGLTKKGKPRKVRGRAAALYPDNIIDLHEEGSAHRPPRQVVGIPPGVERSMEARVRKWMDRVLRMAGAID